MLLRRRFFVFFCFTVLSVEDQTQHEKCLFISSVGKRHEIVVIKYKIGANLFWYFKIAQMLAWYAVVVDAKLEGLTNQSPYCVIADDHN